MGVCLETSNDMNVEAFAIIQYCLHDCGASPSTEHWMLFIGLLVVQETERILLALATALQLALTDAGRTRSTSL